MRDRGPCFQTQHEMLMPCRVHNALTARHNAHAMQGQDSNQEIINEEEETTNRPCNCLIRKDQEEEEEEDKITHQASKIDARIHAGAINMFKRILLLYQGTTEALYDNQMITSLDILQEFDSDTIKEGCCAIKKPCGGTFSHQISKLSMTSIKLFAFWARHMWYTSREVEVWTKMRYDEIKLLMNQKTLEDGCTSSNDPDTPVMSLDLTSAASAFTNMQTVLAKMQRSTGVPLAYVVHHKLKGPNDSNLTCMRDSPAFRKAGSIYLSINNELIAWAPILCRVLTCQQIAASLETLELEGAFDPTFLGDMVKAYNVLHTCWGKSGWWSHLKKFSKTKNGRQVFWTFHTMLLGGPQVVSMGSTIITKLQSIRYEGNQKNFTFDKFVNLQIEQHNQHAGLQEYWYATLPKNMKILWFQDSIKDSSLDAVKASFYASKSKFEDFDSVKDTFVDFKHMQPPTENPRAKAQ
jgi:hypothetical protein